MKIRNGFVSNSSSSSFIIALKKKPKSVDELKDILFSGMTQIGYYSDFISIEDAARRIFNDLKPTTENKIVENISYGYFEGCPKYDWTNKSPSDLYHDEVKAKTGKTPYDLGVKSKEYQKYYTMRDKEWAQEKKERLVSAKKYFDKFKKQNLNMKVYLLTYGDQDGDGALEHGGTFDNIPYLTISHH